MLFCIISRYEIAALICDQDAVGLEGIDRVLNSWHAPTFSDAEAAVVINNALRFIIDESCFVCVNSSIEPDIIAIDS